MLAIKNEWMGTLNMHLMMLCIVNVVYLLVYLSLMFLHVCHVLYTTETMGPMEGTGWEVASYWFDIHTCVSETSLRPSRFV